MREDDQSLLAMWDAKMSTASIARIMGRRESWVDRRVHQLVETRRAAAAIPELPTMRALELLAGGEVLAVPPPAAPAAFQNPVAGRKKRFIGWFLRAKWPPAEIARLFDVEVSDIREAFA